MKRSSRIHVAGVVAVALTVVLLSAGLAAAQPPREQKASLALRAERSAYPPGTEVTLEAVVTIDRGWHVNGHVPTYDWLIPTELTLELPAGSSQPALDYPEAEMLGFAFTEEPIAVYEGTVTIAARFTLPADGLADSAPIAATLGYQACDDKSCLPPVTTSASLTLAIGEGGVALGAERAAAGTGGVRWADLLTKMFFGLLGGLILNAMPCVLPVLSLKLFGLVKSAERGRGHLVAGALATTAGILASFWALALAAVIAKAAGGAVGWGMQFQQPGFVAFLAVVVVLFALNMWGVFEVPLPGALAQAGGRPREGIPGHFVSGLFATLMATPCSAPFLGPAVGFALGQPALVIFAVFTAVGLGLALPYLALAAFPGSARLLPRPGPWMNTLRGVLGFLLSGAAVWLFYVLAAQIGAARLAAVQLLVLLLALCTWLYQRGGLPRAGRLVAAAGIALAALGTIALAAGSRGTGGQVSARSALHDWQPFDESRAVALAAEGRPVFVDFTADWCLTCKTTERLVLETREIADAFADHQVVPMKADWTNPDPVIGSFLARYGRSSVPFYILYRPQQEPFVFGELLTKGRVLDALGTGAAVTATR